ncbi:uncharacterized protein LOC123402470 [Hordeum vulgare subsp. vulgare]|nr:uncharacterized protein LOC123402470 [Hordeum vulgare subsp. vulgare]
MWLGISNSNSKQGQAQGSAAVLAIVCVCTISCMSMLPLAAATIHHEGGAQGSGRGGGSPNPANSLVALVNADRAAAKLPALPTTKGLGCMALQCIARCLALSPATACAAHGTLSPPCHPPETDITQVYAANCGVELPTVDVITGRVLGCSQSIDEAGANATATVRSREHAQVGAGVDRGVFWCLLFSSGSPNSTFKLEAAGRGIGQDHGCFSDPDVALSSCTTSSAAAQHQTRRVAAGFFASTLLLRFLLLFLL